MSGFKETFIKWGLVEEDKKVAQEIVNNLNKPYVPQNKPSLQNVVTPVMKSTGPVNADKEQAAYNSFIMLLDQANLPGPDFFEFYSAIKENILAAGGSVADERMLYNMVFTTLKGMGLTKDILINSNAQYIKLLNSHLDAFHSRQTQVINDRVGSRQIQLNNIKGSISSKEEEIKKLQAEISKLNTDAVTIQQEITHETADVEITTIAFEAAHKRILEEFTKAGTNCNTYLPVVTAK